MPPSPWEDLFFVSKGGITCDAVVCTKWLTVILHQNGATVKGLMVQAIDAVLAAKPALGWSFLCVKEWDNLRRCRVHQMADDQPSSDWRHSKSPDVASDKRRPGRQTRTRPTGAVRCRRCRREGYPHEEDHLSSCPLRRNLPGVQPHAYPDMELPI